MSTTAETRTISESGSGKIQASGTLCAEGFAFGEALLVDRLPLHWNAKFLEASALTLLELGTVGSTGAF